MTSTTRLLVTALFACSLAVYGCSDDPAADDHAHGEDDDHGADEHGMDEHAATEETSAGASAERGGDDAASALALTSSVVEAGALLPAKYRCEGAVGGPTGPNPPLAWSGPPAGTKSFALLLRDRTFMNYQHWTLYDLPADTDALPEGVPVGAETMPEGAKQAINSPGLTGPGYYGPCGPSGVNTYEFKLYALDVESLPDVGTTGATVEAALDKHTLATGSLTVTSGPP